MEIRPWRLGDETLAVATERYLSAGSPAEADLAILVADPWHRQGVATALIRALLPRCYAAGVRRLRADVLPGNRAARELLRSLFAPGLTAGYVDGVVHYELAGAQA